MMNNIEQYYRCLTIVAKKSVSKPSYPVSCYQLDLINNIFKSQAQFNISFEWID